MRWCDPIQFKPIQTHSQLIRMLFHVSVKLLMVFVHTLLFLLLIRQLFFFFFFIVVAVFQYEWHICCCCFVFHLVVDLFFLLFLRKQRSTSVTDENVLVLWYLWSIVIVQHWPSSHSFQIDIHSTISIARGPSTGCVIHLWTSHYLLIYSRHFFEFSIRIRIWFR